MNECGYGRRMYDDDEVMERRPRRGSAASTIFIAVLVSALTSTGMFFGLRTAERRGWLGEAAPTAAAQVPNVVGMPVAQARDFLSSRGFMLVLAQERASARVAAGAIIEQTPLAGSQSPGGSAVNAVVSKGPIRVPALAGASAAEAAEKLRQLGLQLAKEQNAAHATIKAGFVSGSHPPEGTALGSEDAVSLIISTGAAGVQVPKLVGLRLTKAKQVAEQAGFQFGEVRWGYSDLSDGNVVLKQTPDAGGLVAPGSKIDVVVNEP